MKRINIGVIGCGAVAEVYHLPSIRKVPIFRTMALCDINTDRAEYLKKKFCLDDAKVSNDFHETINRDDIEAVIVLTPPKFHVETCLEAAKSGKHIFCEKPFTMTLAEANQVKEAVDKANVKFMIGFNFRFKTEHLKAKEFLSQGYLGEIRQAETYFLINVKSWPSVSKFQYSKQEGGGALFEMGCHHIDLLSWYLGRVRSVSATVESKLIQTVDDEAEVELNFENGAKAEAHMSWSSSVPRNEIRIIGEKGDVAIKEGYISVCLRNKLIFKQGPLELFLRPSQSSYQRELLHFGDCILGDAQPYPGIHEAVENMGIITASYESARLGRNIDVLRESEDSVEHCC